jgi:hypothetical protein
MTLLKNAPVGSGKGLPLSTAAVKTLAVVGPNAQATSTMQGNYAGNPCFNIQSPATALQAYATVTYQQGCAIASNDTSGFAAAIGAAQAADATVLIVGIGEALAGRGAGALLGHAGRVALAVARIAPRDRRLTRRCHPPARTRRQALRPWHVIISPPPPHRADQSQESEGNDRTIISFPGVQDALIQQASAPLVHSCRPPTQPPPSTPSAQVCAASKGPCVVVVMAGGSLDLSAVAANPAVAAIVWTGYPGQSGGVAIANTLFGASAPAGRLVQTIYPASFATDVSMFGERGRGGGRVWRLRLHSRVCAHCRVCAPSPPRRDERAPGPVRVAALHVPRPHVPLLHRHARV